MTMDILSLINPWYQPIIPIFHSEIPDFFLPFFESPALKRLKWVGQNCWTDFCKFYSYKINYSRFEHSLWVGLIAWHFSNDPKIALAGLFHDMSHTVFAHAGDFYFWDTETQDTAERHLWKILRSDSIIPPELKKLGLLIEEIERYELYPLADNPGPQLSADRLEYTLSSGYDLGHITLNEFQEFYNSLVTIDLPGEKIAFNNRAIAEKFALLSIKNDAACYSSYESVSAMHFIGLLLKKLWSIGGFKEIELYTLTESDFIERFKNSSDPELRSMWEYYENLHSYKILRYPKALQNLAFSTRVKRRFIDPLVVDSGNYSTPFRVSEFSETFRQERDYHVGRKEEWIMLDYKG